MEDLPIQKPNQHQLSVIIITQLAQKKKKTNFRAKLPIRKTNTEIERKSERERERKRLKWEIKPGSWRGRPSSRESE